jgi:hypothetical protein
MQGRGRAPLTRTARGRWLLVATAAASALVLALSAGLHAESRPVPKHPAPAGTSAPGVQTRNASENIYSGLPKPSDLGDIGR